MAAATTAVTTPAMPKNTPWTAASSSGTLVRSLLREGLLDELTLVVHPIVVGSGRHLFEEGGDQKAPELVDSKTFSTGVLYLTYQTARREEGESG
jgi:dihydrofolate reductase